jgi:hypothetical protein
MPKPRRAASWANDQRALALAESPGLGVLLIEGLFKLDLNLGGNRATVALGAVVELVI